MSDFPDVRWGSQTSWLRRPMTALSESMPGSWIIRKLAPLDRRVLARTRGRFTLFGPIGAPIMLIATTGAKSGVMRSTPLLYARDGEQLIVVGSNFGQAHHPAWTANLLKNPRAVVTVGGRDVPVMSRLLTGEEALAGYQKMIAELRTYAEYRNRTDRDIRVFALTAL